ncbi:MAG: hypothetical protein H5U12_18215 [Hoeflea sp.]|nr:hypothetical protein [Hoeflea sp.]
MRLEPGSTRTARWAGPPRNPIERSALWGSTCRIQRRWLGFGSVVIPGVRVGNGVIIAARAVVTADVPDYAIVAGNPARLIRMRFTADVITRLLGIAWWNWEVDKIERNIDAITGADVDALHQAT